MVPTKAELLPLILQLLSESGISERETAKEIHRTLQRGHTNDQTCMCLQTRSLRHETRKVTRASRNIAYFQTAVTRWAGCDSCHVPRIADSHGELPYERGELDSYSGYATCRWWGQVLESTPGFCKELRRLCEVLRQGDYRQQSDIDFHLTVEWQRGWGKASCDK